MDEDPTTIDEQLAAVRYVRQLLEQADDPRAALDPSLRSSLGRAGMRAIDAGNGALAREIFDTLIVAEGGEPVHHLMRAHACLAEDAVAEGVRSLSRAIELALTEGGDPEVAGEAYLARGDVLYRLGRHTDARADLCDAVALIVHPERGRVILDFLRTLEGQRLEDSAGPADAEAGEG